MSKLPTWIVAEPYLHVRGILFEGPAYDVHRQELRWVDIGTHEVYFLKLQEGPQSLRKFALNGNTIATLANIKNSEGILLAGAKYGFSTFDPDTGEISQFRSYFDDKVGPTERHRFRANDGAVDARGRVLQGVLIDDKIEKPGPEGTLLSLGLDGKIRQLIEGVVCPNGLGWNAANTIMYWAESGSGNLYAFDYDLDSGVASKQRVLFHLHGENNTNVPDGLVVDVEDHIWLAVWGGSLVLRISPQGLVVGQIELPTRFVTCPVFVGVDLFITTAAEREPESYPKSASYGGLLYRCHIGIQGLPKFDCEPVVCYKE